MGEKAIKWLASRLFVATILTALVLGGAAYLRQHGGSDPSYFLYPQLMEAATMPGIIKVAGTCIVISIVLGIFKR